MSQTKFDERNEMEWTAATTYDCIGLRFCSNMIRRSHTMCGVCVCMCVGVVTFMGPLNRIFLFSLEYRHKKREREMRLQAIHFATTIESLLIQSIQGNSWFSMESGIHLIRDEKRTVLLVDQMGLWQPPKRRRMPHIRRMKNGNCCSLLIWAAAGAGANKRTIISVPNNGENNALTRIYDLLYSTSIVCADIYLWFGVSFRMASVSQIQFSPENSRYNDFQWRMNLTNEGRCHISCGNFLCSLLLTSAASTGNVERHTIRNIYTWRNYVLWRMANTRASYDLGAPFVVLLSRRRHANGQK